MFRRYYIYSKQSNLNITLHTLCHWVDERHNSSQVPKISQMFHFCTPVISSSYDVWGGTHATNPLQTKTIYSKSHLILHSCMRMSSCSTGKEAFLLTDCLQNKTYIIKWRTCQGLEATAFDTGINSHSNALGSDATTATPCGQISAHYPKALGYQDSWGGINRT
jgi:hypothetical protein